MRKIFFLLGTLILGIGSLQAGAINDPVIQNIVDSLKRNTSLANEFGAHQRVVTTRLSDEGSARRIEEKYLKTVWISGQPKNILVRVNCKDFESPIRNSRECVEFTKGTMTKTSKPGRIESEVKKVRWTEMYRNFDFRMLAPEGQYRVLTFSPKKNGVDPENRIEKLLSQMTGKVWIDDDFNVIKAEARLAAPVSFGLGIAAKVNRVSIKYQQQPYGNVQMPSYLSLEFEAKVALVHTERQRIEVFWSDPYRRSDSVWAQVVSSSGSKVASER